MKFFKIGLLFVLGLLLGLFSSGLVQFLFIISAIIIVFSQETQFNIDNYIFVVVFIGIGMLNGNIISLKFVGNISMLLG